MRHLLFVTTLAATLPAACGGRTDDLPSNPARNAAEAGGMVTSVTTESVGGSGSPSSNGGAPNTGGTHQSASLATGGHSATLCGNGIIDTGEYCDDGNVASGDGCSGQCKIEDDCSRLFLPWLDITQCGNSQREIGEGCDDGNLTNGDGCGNNCTVEPGYYCPVPGQPCLNLAQVELTCGNGIVETGLGETCDEAQLNGQPGHCGATCRPAASCGNAVVEPWAGEQCDDGINDATYGGCRPDCTFSAHCGDGVKNGIECCDFGNENSPPGVVTFGGCLTNCRLGPHCGDGIVQSPPEQCDDGTANGTTHSLCSASCVNLIPNM